MTPTPRVTILAGPARSGKTEGMLTMLTDIRPLAIVVTDRTPAQFQSEYRKFYDVESPPSEKTFFKGNQVVRILADIDISSQASALVGVQGIFVSDCPLSPIGSIQSDVQLLSLARLAIQSSADVYAEWSIFREGGFEEEVRKLSLKLRFPVVTDFGKLNAYLVSVAAHEIIVSIGTIFNHLSCSENAKLTLTAREQK